MPDSLQALLIVLLFLVPGYIVVLFLTQWGKWRRPVDHHLVLAAVAFGAINALSALALLGICGSGRAVIAACVQGAIAEAFCSAYQSHPQLTALYLACYSFGLPLIIGYAVTVCRNARVVPRVVSPLVPAATENETWDYLFGSKEEDPDPMWVRVYLNDTAATVYEGMTEHVGLGEDRRAILLGRVAIVDDRGKEMDRTPISIQRGNGPWQESSLEQVYVDGERIVAVEVFDFS